MESLARVATAALARAKDALKLEDAGARGGAEPCSELLSFFLIGCERCSAAAVVVVLVAVGFSSSSQL